MLYVPHAGFWVPYALTGKVIVKLEGHSGSAWTAAFSPDGQHVVTASDDHTARVWNAAAGATIAKLEGHSGPVWTATFSHDLRRVVTASSDDLALIWRIIALDDIAQLLEGK